MTSSSASNTELVVDRQRSDIIDPSIKKVQLIKEMSAKSLNPHNETNVSNDLGASANQTPAMYTEEIQNLGRLYNTK
jgi:hypothetical protein